ncbi:MAG: outer membrane beta-barrel protein [Rickettsiales bacterium]|jgi:hypothetical protein|nr:outer membrane beta-barrel protein [Rickettsiales bacterium]
MRRIKNHFLILVLFAFLPVAVFAEFIDLDRKFYIGLHGNNSWSITKDGGHRIDKKDGGLNPNFSLTAGVERKSAKYEKARLFVGAELFFDNIDETTIQNDKPWTDNLGVARQRPMAGKPIYKTNFLTGIRGRLGISLSETVKLYGHMGFLYWDRDLYVRVSDDRPYWWDTYNEVDKFSRNWKVRPFAGIGATVRITGHWAINASYMTIMQSRIGGLWGDWQGNDYNYSYGNFTMDIDILTIGVQYYF